MSEAGGPTEERGSGLRDVALRGVRWTALSRGVIESFGLASTIILARLIPPAAFGRAAVALVVVALSVIIGPTGISAGVVQRRELTPAQIRATAFLCYATGFGLTLTTAVVGLTIGSRLFGDSTGELIVLASPAWALTAVGGVSQALLQRRLDFRTMAMRDALAAVGGTSTAVLLAILGADGAALVLGALAVVTVTALVSFIAAPQPVLVGRPRGIRDVTGFAGTVTLSQVVFVLHSNIDYLILGIRLTATEVGYYFRAFQLGVDYQGKISGIMQRVSFPVFSRASDMAQLRRARAAIVRTHASILLPILATFIAVAPDVVPFLYGSEWEGAVQPAQILAVAGMAYSVTTGLGPLMVAMGRARELLRWNVCDLVGYTVVIWTLSGFGLIPVAIGVALFSSAVVIVIQHFILRPIVGLTMQQLWHDVRAGLTAAILVVAACIPLQHALDPEVSVLPRMVAVGLVAVGLTFFVYSRVFPEAAKDLFEVIPVGKLLRRRAAESPAPKGPS